MITGVIIHGGGKGIARLRQNTFCLEKLLDAHLRSKSTRTGVTGEALLKGNARELDEFLVGGRDGGRGLITVLKVMIKAGAAVDVVGVVIPEGPTDFGSNDSVPVIIRRHKVKAIGLATGSSFVGVVQGIQTPFIDGIRANIRIKGSSIGISKRK